jgi:cupin fold WbuC family metalloprotein
MIIIDEPLTSSVIEEARKSPRLRKNYNFHSDYADPTNRMLNAMEPGTYLRPHKHESPDKWETFLILSGKALVIQFDDAGAITDGVILDHAHGIYGIEIPARVWHTVVPLTAGTVLYEVKPGPYVPLDDKNFAPWAPSEGAPEVSEYLDALLDHYCLR